MKFEEIRNIFKKELLEIDNFIKKKLKSDISLIGDVGNYITSHEGKKIRPIITLLFSKMLKTDTNNAIKISSAIELIHTATLLHDDVVDNSEKRRNKSTTNKIWGNKESILIGDYLYTKSFEIMVDMKNIKILKHMAKTTNIMSEGEVNQLLNRNNFDIKETDYFNIIKSKTARLFASSATANAIISNKYSFVKNAFKYGINLGIAYQLIDDMLDYTSEDNKFGKNTGSDILTGTFTLPLIYVMKKNKEKKELIKNIIIKNDIDKIINIKNIVVKSDALDYTLNLAKLFIEKSKKAISFFDNSKYKEIALILPDFIIKRTH